MKTGQMPMYHYIVGMTFEGKVLLEGATLKQYGVVSGALCSRDGCLSRACKLSLVSRRAGATIHMDIRRDAFNIPTISAPVHDGLVDGEEVEPAPHVELQRVQ